MISPKVWRCRQANMLVACRRSFDRSVKEIVKSLFFPFQVNDATGKTKEALEQTRTNIQKTAEDLRKAHPEVEQQANAMREKIESAVKNVAVVSSSV